MKNDGIDCLKVVGTQGKQVMIDCKTVRLSAVKLSVPDYNKQYLNIPINSVEVNENSNSVNLNNHEICSLQ